MEENKDNETSTEIHECLVHHEKLVWPLVGLVANLPTEIDESQGLRIGTWGSRKLHDKLIEKGFDPVRVQQICDFKEHSGFAMVEFTQDYEGFHNAMSFERHFKSNRHGQRDWKGSLFKCLRDDEFYGWIAREEDYNREGIIGKHIRKNRVLKSLSQIQEQDERESLVPEIKPSLPQNCSIFKAPPELVQSNPTTYVPKIVSIGPYYSNDTCVQMVQQHKHRILELYLAHTNEETDRESLYAYLASREKELREYYYDSVDHIGSHEFLNMLLLDGSFILMTMLIAKCNYHLFLPKTSDDTIFGNPRIIQYVKDDFVVLGNQIPYLILETLFDNLAKRGSIRGGIKQIVYSFFEDNLNTNSNRVLVLDSPDFKHILDLIRKTLAPSSLHKVQEERRITVTPTSKFPLSATELLKQGIKFEANREAHTILDIKLKNHTLKVPPLVLDRFKKRFFLNIIAFEHCRESFRKDITSYVVFMGFLMKDTEAVALMCNNGIVENCLGTNEELSHFFKDTTNGITFTLCESDLANVFWDVNAYTSVKMNRVRARCKNFYADTLCTFISSVAGFIIVCVTIGALVIAVLAYRNDLKGDGEEKLAVQCCCQK